MSYTPTMSATFEAEKNKKALAYTAMICAAILLLAILISWRLPQSHPIIQELIEINLGNDAEGYGTVQPLIKGEKGLSSETPEQPKAAAVKNQATEDPQDDDNTDKESAPVTKPEKKTVKVNTPTPPVVTPAPKPQKPKATYGGGTTDSKGNGATEDNYKYGQGNNPNGKGDAGSPSGKPDSYGNTPGGKAIGPRVIGNRKIIKYYSFTDELPRATINALVKVSPSGQATFAGFGKGSTSTEQRYANSIIRHLVNVTFDKAATETTVTVVFNFNVN